MLGHKSLELGALWPRPEARSLARSLGTPKQALLDTPWFFAVLNPMTNLKGLFLFLLLFVVYLFCFVLFFISLPPVGG